jgi:hypothetical protein
MRQALPRQKVVQADVIDWPCVLLLIHVVLEKMHSVNDVLCVIEDLRHAKQSCSSVNTLDTCVTLQSPGVFM